MIRGYPGRPSVRPGEVLQLHVATDAARFRVALHRWADGFVPMGETGWFEGTAAPEGRPDVDWQWPASPIDIPAHWPSGPYLAHLLESDHPVTPLAPWMDRACALFVVRGPGRAPVLYRLPFATYQAYNATGGGCFYAAPPRSSHPPGARLTWHRPGGGTGGEVFGAPDHYDPSSPRQTFAHWDAHFIRWLARRGTEVEFCADLDLHDEADLLRPHRLLLSVGHDEYWTQPMRDQVERHVAAGGNAAFFGANVCWWRIHWLPGPQAMVCHQGGPAGALDHWWPPSGAGRPEDTMSGVSYRHGGGCWDGPRDTAGFIVQQGEHWLFEGTGCATGDRFGQASRPPLVGYECDGAPLQWRDEPSGLAELLPWCAECGTPAGFQPLAIGPLAAHWQELPQRERHGPGQGLHTATLGLYQRHGTVFTAGTTDWAQVLAKGSEPAVQRITANVLDRLSRRGPEPLATLLRGSRLPD